MTGEYCSCGRDRDAGRPVKPVLERAEGSGRWRLAEEAREELTEPPREDVADALREVTAAAVGLVRGDERCRAAWRCLMYAVGSKRELLGARCEVAEPADDGREERAGAGDGERDERWGRGLAV